LDEKQQQTAFATDLEALVDRYLNEFDMTFASMSGVLFCFATRTVIDSYMSKMAETVLEEYELVDEEEEEEEEEDDEGDEWKSTDDSE
jgi:hypothetical protein